METAKITEVEARRDQRVEEIERHMATIRAWLKRARREPASWPAVGSLGHVATELEDLAVFVTRRDEGE